MVGHHDLDGCSHLCVLRSGRRAVDEKPGEAVRIWPTSPNRLLGKRPLVAVAAGRAPEVLSAWDAYVEGSFG